jgi:hypothetical protein
MNKSFIILFLSLVVLLSSCDENMYVISQNTTIYPNATFNITNTTIINTTNYIYNGTNTTVYVNTTVYNGTNITNNQTLIINGSFNITADSGVMSVGNNSVVDIDGGVDIVTSISGNVVTIDYTGSDANNYVTQFNSSVQNGNNASLDIYRDGLSRLQTSILFPNDTRYVTNLNLRANATNISKMNITDQRYNETGGLISNMSYLRSGNNITLIVQLKNGSKINASFIDANQSSEIIGLNNSKLNRGGDNATRNSRFNWNESNMTQINEADAAKFIGRKNPTLNWSIFAMSYYPRKNACYSVGYYTPVVTIPSGTPSLLHTMGFGWYDDLFVWRGSTSTANYTCIENDTLIRLGNAQNIVQEQTPGIRDNSLNGYDYVTEKQTIFYDTEDYFGVELGVYPLREGYLVYNYYYPVTFTRPYEVGQKPDITATCEFNGAPNQMFRIMGGYVVDSIDLVTNTGFIGWCQVFIPIVGQLPQDPEAAILFNWHSTEREDGTLRQNAHLQTVSSLTEYNYTVGVN